MNTIVLTSRQVSENQVVRKGVKRPDIRLMVRAIRGTTSASPDLEVDHV